MEIRLNVSVGSRIGPWPSGKATGFDPVIPGSIPGGPATENNERIGGSSSVG